MELCYAANLLHRASRRCGSCRLRRPHGSNCGQSRNGNFSGALIEGRRTRDWEFHFKGLIFHGNHYTGPAIKLEWVQTSVFEALVIQDFGGDTAAVFGDTVLSSTVFRDVQLNWNQNPVYLKNVNDLRWQGGNSQINWSPGGWAAGLKILGGTHNPPPTGNYIAGPVLVENFHIEGSRIDITGIRKLTWRGGYHVGADVHVNSSYNIAIQCDGYYHSSLIRENNNTTSLCTNDSSN